MNGVSGHDQLCIATKNCFFVTNLLKIGHLAAGHLTKRVVFGR
jgi:hypothetical protein